MKPYRSQVKHFIEINWHKWNDEKPPWFMNAKASIPYEFLPVVYKKALSNLRAYQKSETEKINTAKIIGKSHSLAGGEIMKLQLK